MKSVKYWTPRPKASGDGVTEEELENRRKVKDFLAKDWITRFSTVVWSQDRLPHYDLSTYKK